ncbi:hypothetical protein F5144DRAFT_548498 [Chaetomium tenue]|uniref:Uncharacterized protein n=1 Tax=Chaetomium tenue TaxID=1854479 RepID=A0ACB7PAR6_9PEZI|nr:hypothetical protein F5144DRAFT_548498 [Chaetomium globosum]
MLLHLTTLLLLPLGALTAAVQPLTPRAVSPDNSCGASHSSYTCPGALPCCSQYGFCGATDAFCLTTAKCQTKFSNTTAACHAPVPGTSVSIDGTCGTEGAGKEGYRCPGNATVTSCCSAAGYCGTTADHCSAETGCQEKYGNCTKAAAAKDRRRSVLLF